MAELAPRKLPQPSAGVPDGSPAQPGISPTEQGILPGRTPGVSVIGDPDVPTTLTKTAAHIPPGDHGRDNDIDNLHPTRVQVPTMDTPDAGGMPTPLDSPPTPVHPHISTTALNDTGVTPAVEPESGGDDGPRQALEAFQMDTATITDALRLAFDKAGLDEVWRVVNAADGTRGHFGFGPEGAVVAIDDPRFVEKGDLNPKNIQAALATQGIEVQVDTSKYEGRTLTGYGATDREALVDHIRRAAEQTRPSVESDVYPIFDGRRWRDEVKSRFNWLANQHGLKDTNWVQLPEDWTRDPSIDLRVVIDLIDLINRHPHWLKPYINNATPFETERASMTPGARLTHLRDACRRRDEFLSQLPSDPWHIPDTEPDSPLRSMQLHVNDGWHIGNGVVSVQINYDDGTGSPVSYGTVACDMVDGELVFAEIQRRTKASIDNAGVRDWRKSLRNMMARGRRSVQPDVDWLGDEEALALGARALLIDCGVTIDGVLIDHNIPVVIPNPEETLHGRLSGGAATIFKRALGRQTDKLDPNLMGQLDPELRHGTVMDQGDGILALLTDAEILSERLVGATNNKGIRTLAEILFARISERTRAAAGLESGDDLIARVLAEDPETSVRLGLYRATTFTRDYDSPFGIYRHGLQDLPSQQTPLGRRFAGPDVELLSASRGFTRTPINAHARLVTETLPAVIAPPIDHLSM